MEASSVMEGQREETPPRKDFYSKAVTTSQLKEINKCQLQMCKDFPQKSEKSPKKKVASKGDNKAPSKKSRKRKQHPRAHHPLHPRKCQSTLRRRQNGRGRG